VFDIVIQLGGKVQSSQREKRYQDWFIGFTCLLWSTRRKEGQSKDRVWIYYK